MRVLPTPHTCPQDDYRLYITHRPTNTVKPPNYPFNEQAHIGRLQGRHTHGSVGVDTDPSPHIWWLLQVGVSFVSGPMPSLTADVLSNALTLEQLTTYHPRSGNLITFAQFLIITLVFLPRFVVLRRSPIPHLGLRERRVPLAPYALQVVLFAAISLLNNAAFAYAIPMSVHIIFRSGGLVSSLLMNWLALRRR